MIDLHCHPLPGIDDGVRSASEGVRLLVGLRALGFDKVVATPHVRPGVWDNRLHTRSAAREALGAELDAAGDATPDLLLAGEHMFDDVLRDLLAKGEALTYPEGGAVLVEFPYEDIPMRVELQLWRMVRAGVRPVLAHPERYIPVQRSDDRLEELVGAGAWLLLDVMALVGAYGRKAQTTAERILAKGLYFAACSDAHKPSDVDGVREGLTALRAAVGEARFHEMMVEGPARALGLRRPARERLRDEVER